MIDFSKIRYTRRAIPDLDLEEICGYLEFSYSMTISDLNLIQAKSNPEEIVAETKEGIRHKLHYMIYGEVSDSLRELRAVVLHNCGTGASFHKISEGFEALAKKLELP